jgi:transposase
VRGLRIGDALGAAIPWADDRSPGLGRSEGGVARARGHPGVARALGASIEAFSIPAAVGELSVRASRGLLRGFILDVYRIERAVLDADLLGTPEHLGMRQTQSKTVMDEFRTWLLAEQNRHPPRGPMGEAISYALGQWDPLTLFLTDPHLPIDNNASERALRVAALGRKNFLFVGTDEAGENLAGLYSLVATCEVNGVNPVSYLADVLLRVQTHPASRIDELLPHNWKPPEAQPSA